MEEARPHAAGVLGYRRDYDNWIGPFLGHREAAVITELDVQAWVDRDLARLSAKTVADRHALLHGIMAWAATRKRALIPQNPCLETDLPKRTKRPPKGLTLPEWLALKDAAYRVDEDAADLILFLGNTGWRIGEGAKSAAGLRRIRMLPECAAMLRRRVVGKGPSDLGFTNAHSPLSVWEPSTFRNRWWTKAVTEAGLAARRPTRTGSATPTCLSATRPGWGCRRSSGGSATRTSRRRSTSTAA